MAELTPQQLKVERMSEYELSEEHLILLNICIDMPFTMEKSNTPEMKLLKLMGIEIQTRMSAL